MHKIKKTLSVTLLIMGLISLNACAPGGGYGSKGWENRSPRVQTPAQSAPENIDQQSAAQIENAPAAPIDNLAPVKVAILLPLSGQHKTMGESMLNAAQIALFDVGHTRFELMPRDTLGTPAGAKAAAQNAVNNGAQLILGPVFAASVRAAQPVAQNANINMIAFSTDWTLAGGNTYIMGFLPFDQVERVAKFAAAQGIKRTGILVPDTDYGRIVKSTFSTIAPRYGIALSQNATYAANSSNLAPDIRSFSLYEERAASNALARTPFDAVLMPTGGEQARTIANLLTYNQLPPSKLRRIGTGLFDDPALATEANLDGAWFAAPSPDSRKSFESRYIRTYGTKPQRLATLAYDSTALAAILARTGLQQQGRPAFTRQDLMNPNGFAGIDGIFRFRPNGTAERGLAVLTYNHGQIKVLGNPPSTFQQQQQ